MCRLDQQREAILCISDREYTKNDRKFEPKHSAKSWWLSPANAVSLFCDDAAQHFETIRRVHEKLVAKGFKGTIDEVARLYQRNLRAVAQERKHKASVESITAGFDAGGAHLYRVNGTHVTCVDEDGFCAVGAGEELFSDFLELSGYDRFWDVWDTWLLMYEAKKKAEKAVGVGPTTDVGILCESDNGPLPEAAAALEAYYCELQEAIKKQRRLIIDKMKKDARFTPHPGRL
jgi:hypothetical protein